MSDADKVAANEVAERIVAIVDRYVLAHDRVAACNDMRGLVDVVSRHAANMAVEETRKALREVFSDKPAS